MHRKDTRMMQQHVRLTQTYSTSIYKTYLYLVQDSIYVADTFALNLNRLGSITKK